MLKQLIAASALTLAAAAGAQVGPAPSSGTPAMTTAPTTGIDARGDRARTGRDALAVPGASSPSSIVNGTTAAPGGLAIVPTVPPVPGTSTSGDGSATVTPGTAGTPPRF